MNLRRFICPRQVPAIGAMLAVLTMGLALAGCEEDQSSVKSGTYYLQTTCYGSSCADDPTVLGLNGLTMTVYRSEGRVEFHLPPNQPLSVGYSIAPEEDWPADCYTVNDGQTPMEVFVLDAALEINGFEFEHPILVRDCAETDSVSVNLLDSDGPAYPWSCSSGGRCFAFSKGS